jgi:hypothetical protein
MIFLSTVNGGSHVQQANTQDVAMVGHIDRQELHNDDETSHPWNSVHLSRGPAGGCSQADLRSTGGGLFYCFVAD